MVTNSIGLDIAILIVGLAFIFVIISLMKSVKSKTSKDDDKDDFNDEEFIRYMRDVVTNYKRLVERYDEISDDLIDKIKKLLSEDAGYFDYDGFNFNLNKYYELVKDTGRFQRLSNNGIVILIK